MYYLFTSIHTDITKPDIICPKPISVEIPKDQSNISVAWPYPVAFDNSEKRVELTSSHNPGEVFQLGTTNVTITGTDPSGNVANCTFTVSLHATNYTKQETEALLAEELLVEKLMDNLAEAEATNSTAELERNNSTKHNDFSIFQNLTPLFKGIVGSPKPLIEYIHHGENGKKTKFVVYFK